MKSSFKYVELALQSMKDKWLVSSLIMIIYIIIGASINILSVSSVAYTAEKEQYIGSLFRAIVELLIMGPIVYGCYIAYLENVRLGRLNVKTIFTGFNDYVRVISTVIHLLFYLFLWALLLVIPAIIKYFSYSMTFYILKDNPGMSCNAAINRSVELMEGHKFDLFVVYVHYIWISLAILLFFILGGRLLNTGINSAWWVLSYIIVISFVLGPCTYTSLALFYEDLLAEETISE